MIEDIINSVLSNLDKFDEKYIYQNGNIDAVSILKLINKKNIILDDNEQNRDFLCFKYNKNTDIYPFLQINSFLLSDSELEPYIEDIKILRKEYNSIKLSRLIAKSIIDTELLEDIEILSKIINYSYLVYNFIYEDELYIIYNKYFDIYENVDGGNVIYDTYNNMDIFEFMKTNSELFIYLNLYETKNHIFITYKLLDEEEEKDCVFRFSNSFHINQYIENMINLNKFVFFSELFEKYYNQINYLPSSINYLEINTLKFINEDTLIYSDLNFDTIIVDWIEYIDGVFINTKELIIRNIINISLENLFRMVSNSTTIILDEDIINEVDEEEENLDIDEIIDYMVYKGYSIYKEVVDKKKIIKYQV